MVKEVMVILKDASKTLREKFLIYEDIQADIKDPTIKNCIDKTVENFKGRPDEVTVKISFEV